MAVLALTLMVSLGVARAGDLEPVTTSLPEVTVDHVLSVIGVPGRSSLSLADIERLPLVRFALEADPAGMDGMYTGVRLADLLRDLGLDDAPRVILRASDSYSVLLVPAEEEGLDTVLFATRFEAEPLAADGRGPFRLIWTHNAEDVGAGTASSAKWIWNIVSIRKAN